MRLTERDFIEREQRAAGRRIKNAQFPVLKTLENFDFKLQASINEIMVREFAASEYIASRESALNTRTGSARTINQKLGRRSTRQLLSGDGWKRWRLLKSSEAYLGPAFRQPLVETLSAAQTVWFQWLSKMASQPQ